MKIIVDKDLRVHRRESENLKELSCEVYCQGRQAVSDVLQAMGGKLEEKHVWMPIAWLGEGEDETWRRQFEAMIDYARSKGWVDGERARAHVNWLL